jgi:hypothetical protein
MNYNEELLKILSAEDGRKTLPRHPTKVWSRRDPAALKGLVLHQSLSAEGKAAGVARYHAGPNHISPEGLPGLSYTLFVETSGKLFLANDVEDKTLSQGNADLPGDENEMYLSVCFGGNFSGPGYQGTQVPSPEQMQMAVTLWAKVKELWSWKNNQLFGHYDFGKAACPGNELSKFIESVNSVMDWAGERFNLDTVTGRQEALKQLGYDPKDMTGTWTIDCRAALTEFQKKSGLTPDGVWGNKTTTAMIAALG